MAEYVDSVPVDDLPQGTNMKVNSLSVNGITHASVHGLLDVMCHDTSSRKQFYFI